MKAGIWGSQERNNIVSWHDIRTAWGWQQCSHLCARQALPAEPTHGAVPALALDERQIAQMTVLLRPSRISLTHGFLMPSSSLRMGTRPRGLLPRGSPSLCRPAVPMGGPSSPRAQTTALGTITLSGSGLSTPPPRLPYPVHVFALF